MSIIKVENLIFEYEKKDEKESETIKKRAIDSISFTIEKGQFVSILGHNGSGKSTLAKHFNAILTPTSGTVLINEMDTKEASKVFDIRKTVGLVFQNPDNQMVASSVEEEVAFAPENLGLSEKEIIKRVEDSLAAVGMTEYKKTNPIRLSGGQKQRIAIAGILALNPECIVLDEPTAMLDPKGRKDVLKVLSKLNKEENMTIILITHNMEETIFSDRIIVMDEGKILLDGVPKEVFKNVEKLNSVGLDVPVVTKLAYLLRENGINISNSVLTDEEFVLEIQKYLKEI